ncbi:receptor-like protein kinase FERONIA [Vigna radiata var. radiata]|uniref:Receptor-like protein kinase FERONIA n=1 Tax=Vigna radiata var. radiata TaxID=3916 RepID=A0A1S3TV81_VIGRR|nr:receptor-like protein kinase FERONIA [Vigna radiata var. radiata]
MFLKCLSFSCSKNTSQRNYPTIIQELSLQFSLSHLTKSTNNFDPKRLVGSGAFCNVYEASLQRSDGSPYTVAIKRFMVKDSDIFKNEIELLCQLRHPNIVSLVGFCNHKKEKIIVYEYLSNESLYQHIQSGKLSWKKRLEICIGAARGLHYLHAGAKRTIIHRDIKPSNILLDANMEPKISGFGLSVQGQRFMSKPKPIKVDSVAGTIGYIAAEQIENLTITDKTDVYSFGMVLLEVVSGKTYMNLIQEEEVFERPVEEKVDPKIKGKITPESWQVFIDILQGCLKYEVDERPTMGEVELQLEHTLSLQEQADITNIHGDYVLLSKTIINLKPELEDEDIGITEDSDSEEMGNY